MATMEHTKFRIVFEGGIGHFRVKYSGVGQFRVKQVGQFALMDIPEHVDGGLKFLMPKLSLMIKLDLWQHTTDLLPFTEYALVYFCESC